MDGALPHRDFGDPYTGGLSALGAVAFRIFGVRLTVLRDVMFAAFVLTLPVFFLIAARFVGPWPGAVVTGLAVVWSVPNYPAAVPSWYNLFCAILALGAYLRFVDTGGRRWLAASGMAAGMSIALKIVGVYLVLALLLGLVYREQDRTSASILPDAPDSAALPGGFRWYGIALTGALLLLPVALFALVRTNLTPATAAQFVVPGGALAGALVAREWAGGHGPSAERMRHLLHLAGPLLAGLAIPMIALVTPYVAAHALHPLVMDVLVRASQRLRFATLAPPDLRSGWPSLAIGVVLLVSSHLGMRWQWLLSGVSAVIALVAGTVARFQADTYSFVWGAARIVIPLTVVSGCLLLGLADRRRDRGRAESERLFMVLSITSFCSLVQFPFSAPIYWCYVAPLAALAVVAVLAVALLAFGVTRVNGQSLASLGITGDPGPMLAPLALDRAGLRVPTDDKESYEELVALMRTHVGPSGYAYAGPDAPEVTFLAGLRDPTASLFDFLDDSTTHVGSILAALRAHDVRVVALHHDAEFSPLDSGLDSTLRRWYPEADTVGSFDVRWR
jgi:hypothetical protein